VGNFQFQQAADLGDAGAQNSVGRFMEYGYTYGDGEGDPAAAYEWCASPRPMGVGVSVGSHPMLIPTVNGNTVRSFSTHGQQSASKGSSTTVSRSDIQLTF
jgi:hypothetical protein